MRLESAAAIQGFMGREPTNLRVITFGVTHRVLTLGLGFGGCRRRLILGGCFFISGYFTDGVYVANVREEVDRRRGECFVLHGASVDLAHVDADGERIVEAEGIGVDLLIKFTRASVGAEG